MTSNKTADEHESGERWAHSHTKWSVGVPSLALGPLQTVTVEQTRMSAVETGLLVVLLTVGSLLTYHAVRGYRRNADPSMAWFAVGLCLLTVVHAALKLAAEFVAPALFGSGQSIIFTVAATSQVVDILGLAVVFYAILR